MATDWGFNPESISAFASAAGAVATAFIAFATFNLTKRIHKNNIETSELSAFISIRPELLASREKMQIFRNAKTCKTYLHNEHQKNDFIKMIMMPITRKTILSKSLNTPESWDPLIKIIDLSDKASLTAEIIHNESFSLRNLEIYLDHAADDEDMEDIIKNNDLYQEKMKNSEKLLEEESQNLAQQVDEIILKIDHLIAFVNQKIYKKEEML